MPKKKEEPKEPEARPAVHINAPFAYVQAAQSLQMAEHWAIERQDYDALIESAAVWIEMGGHLLDNGVDLVYDEDAGTVAQKDLGDAPVGFGFTTGGTSDNKPAEDKPKADG